MYLDDLIKRAKEVIASSKGECFCEEEDAKKLTTKDKKALKDSSYCGPRRSFPIIDCKHQYARCL